MATVKRSEVTVVPSSRTTSTGPSTRSGPSGSMVTRRGVRAGSGVAGPVGTDDHQLFGVLAGGDQAQGAEMGGTGAHDGAEGHVGAVGDGGLEPEVAQQADGAL